MTLNHLHFILTGYILENKSNLPEDPKEQVDFIEELLEDIVVAADMNILSGPHVVYCDKRGNEGVTGTVVIETSHASIHIWENCPNTGRPNLVQFDLYSCKDFDEEKIIDLLIMRLGIMDIQGLLLDRNPQNIVFSETETASIH